MTAATLDEADGMEVRLGPGEGRARVVRGAALRNNPVWAGMFAGLRKNSRYYEILEETIQQGFDYQYLIMEDGEGIIRGIQPMFFLDQDLLQGAGPRVRAFFKRLRKVMPRLAVWRTLMVGCAAGEGHLGLGEDDADQAAMCTLLHRVLKQYARRSHAKMVVLKEFPAEYRPALEKFAANGYVRIPSFPMVRLAIDYADFEAFAEKVIGKATRKDLRRKFKKTAPDSENPVSMEVVEDITAVVEEIYPLYLQVYERSEMRFEKLTKEYMCRLGQEMPETVRFFIWRLRGKAVAMSLCMLQGDRIYDEYLGLDYELALDLNLYFVTLRDVLDWSMKQGLKWYYSSALGYKPKLHFKCELVPLDLYVTHTSRLVNQVLRWILPWLEPTRKDETLKKFPNAASLWGER